MHRHRVARVRAGRRARARPRGTAGTTQRTDALADVARASRYVRAASTARRPRPARQVAHGGDLRQRVGARARRRRAGRPTAPAAGSGTRATAGRWLDDAPWGWAPYHYGRWVHVGSYWAWAPGPDRGAAGLRARARRVPRRRRARRRRPRPLGWAPLGWGEPVIPWWGRPRFVGRPYWGGWGGPRVVNNVVVNRTTTVNVTNINVYKNVHVTNAVVGCSRDRFGHGRDRRVPHRAERGAAAHAGARGAAGAAGGREPDAADRPRDAAAGRRCASDPWW